MRNFGLAILVGAVTAALAAGTPAADQKPGIDPAAKILKWKDGKKAVFMLEFDDSCESHIKNAIPELQKHGMVGTFYINPGNGPNPYRNQQNAWEKVVPTTTNMVYGNHTLTHKGVQNAEELEKEIIQCNEVIDRCFPNLKKPRLISFGQPGGVPWKVSKEEMNAVLAKYNMVSRPPFFGPPLSMKKREEMLAVIDNALKRGEMGHLDFHGVGGDWHVTAMEDFRAILDKLEENKEQLWITDPVSWHQYAKERDGSTLAVASSGKDAVKLLLSCSTDPALYDLPLTLSVAVPAEWGACQVEQGGKKTDATATGGRLIFAALPASGEISIHPAGK